MNAQEIRTDAIRATRGQLRFVGVEPQTATPYEIEAACNEVRPEFAKHASDNQWKLFISEFKRWQKEN